ncbi:AfsR/SARP family transcriptional regulator [Nonomuraea glycinis]|uniref:AfsR/SARP family transcriptional regulator n=1 Tax=Nonomuraea glycinis TaxID=2047744 RepID=UPI00339F9CAE
MTDGDPGPGGPQTLRLQVMGPLRVWRGDTELDAGPRQQRCLLALLLARGGRPIAMTDLIDLIWGPKAPPSAVNVIHKYVGALRRLLEPGLRARATGSYLVRQGNGYRFLAGPETLDLIAFRQRVAAGRASAAAGDVEQALDRYADALLLCHGHAGEGLSESAAAMATFATVDGEFYEAAAAAAEIATRVRRPSPVLAPLRLAMKMGPLNEPVHASLMTALAAAGHQAEALAVYRTIRHRLAEDLGIDPGHDLQEAHRRVLNQTVAPAGENPPLLEAGRTAAAPLVRPAQLPPDLPLFAGREAELDILRGLVAGMRDERRSSPLVVAMDGMGGVGKSTLATRLAHLVAAEFADGQLYLDLQGDQDRETGLPARDALPSLLYALGVPASNIPDTCDARIGTYRSLTAGRRFLILLDNVRDSEQVRPLLPNSAGSLVLITSRRPLTALAAFDGAHLVRVDVPDLSSARALLARRLAELPDGAGAESADPEILDEIIELCGRLPLALAVLAARLIARPRLSPATLLAELRDGARRIEDFPGVRDPRTTCSWS